MPKVAILAYDGVATFELGCAVELFALERPEIQGWYQGEVVSFDNKPLRATGGLSLRAKHVRQLDNYDMLLVPSWPLAGLGLDNAYLDAVFSLVERGGRIISFCSGAFFLGELGLLDKRDATTHWRYAEVFKARFPLAHYVEDVLYIYDGKLGCSAGSAAAIDLGMAVIRQDFGYDIANLVARRLVMAPQRSGGQSQFVETPMLKHNDAFAGALDWAVQNLGAELSVESLAEKACMSRRSFDRHFRSAFKLSPLEWLSRQRLAHAQRLLESTSLSIERISEQAGFKTALTLRNNFQKYLSISPGQYRAQFGKSAAIIRKVN